MSTRCIAYPPEFRRQIVELMRAGRPVLSLAKEFEVSPKSASALARIYLALLGRVNLPQTG